MLIVAENAAFEFAGCGHGATHNFQTSGARKTTTTPNQNNSKERRSGSRSLPRAQQLDATLRLPFCFSRRPKSGQTLFEKDRSKAIGPRSYPLNGHPELVVMSAFGSKADMG